MELKLSDEQYEKIGNEISNRIQGFHPYAEIGCAAVDAVLADVLPIVLAEPSRAEVDQVIRKELGFGSTGKVSPDFYYGARLVIANRLARFTAPKDAAVEAVPYSVECERGGCEHCGHDRQWAIVFHNGQPDEFQLSTTFGDKEEAEWIAEQANDAYQRGLRAADMKAGRMTQREREMQQ